MRAVIHATIALSLLYGAAWLDLNPPAPKLVTIARAK